MVKPKVPNGRRLASKLTARLRYHPKRPPKPVDAADATRRLEVLEGVSVFFMQPKSVVRVLAREAREITVHKGDVLISQGQPNDRLFVISRGSFAASVEAPGGGSLPIAMLGPLDIFGVLSLASNVAADATVTATTGGEVLVIDGNRVLALDERGAMASELQRVRAQRSALLEGARRRTRVPTGTGSLIAVYSPKGGAGKTTLALNLCAALATIHPDQVALLDLGLPYNDAALVSGLTPTTCLARLVDGVGAFDELVLSSALHHPAQFFLLPVVLQPEEADLITPEVVSKTTEAILREFRYVVVDCGVQLSEPLLAVFEQAQHVVVITTPRLTSLKDVPHLIDILQGVLHVPSGRIHLIINRTSHKAALGRVEIERIVGRRATVDVDYDPSAERAAVRGELPANVRPSGPIATGAMYLAASITGRRAADRGFRLADVASHLRTARRRGLA
jgi:Flp pilus assembly CpaE family ATPase